MISWLADLVMKWGLPAGDVGDEIRIDLAREADDRAGEYPSGAIARWRLFEAIKIVVRFSLGPKNGGLRSGGTYSRRIRWDVLQDVRFGIRMLRRRPAFTAVAVLTLALGIGANTTIFSVVNAVLMRPLQVEEPHRLMSVFTSYSGGNRYGITSFPDFEDLRSRNEVFSGLAAQAFSFMGLVGPDGSEVVLGQLVSWDYFSILGVQAETGRTFLEEEDQTLGTHPVAVLSHASWQRRFGADPGIVGGEVSINGFPFTVVGVAPEGFGGLSTILTTEVWVPLMMAEQAFPYSVNLEGRVDPWLYLVGRLRSGVSSAQAQAAMDVLSASLRQEHPALNEGKSVTVVAASRTRIYPDATIDSAERLSAILMGIVGLVLLIACFNVANLHLARASGRQREIALRLSLGASRWPVVRLLLTESLLISVAAGMVSLLLAQLALGLVTGMLPPTASAPVGPVRDVVREAGFLRRPERREGSVAELAGGSPGRGLAPPVGGCGPPAAQHAERIGGGPRIRPARRRRPSGQPRVQPV
jgi:predicted permease